MIDAAFGHWLAGFIDGEGSFGIYPAGQRRALAPRFTLALRDDDAAILYEIVERTGIGHVKLMPETASRPHSKPQAYWFVYGIADQVRLVEILDRHPLRAKKRRDYAIWREAVLVRASETRKGAKYPRLSELRERLAADRAYP